MYICLLIFMSIITKLITILNKIEMWAAPTA